MARAQWLGNRSLGLLRARAARAREPQRDHRRAEIVAQCADMASGIEAQLRTRLGSPGGGRWACWMRSSETSLRRSGGGPRAARRRPAEHIPERQGQERAEDQGQERAVRLRHSRARRRRSRGARRRRRAPARRSRSGMRVSPAMQEMTSGSDGQPARGGDDEAAGAGEELLALRQVGFADEAPQRAAGRSGGRGRSRRGRRGSCRASRRARRSAGRRARRAPPSPSCWGSAARGRRRAGRSRSARRSCDRTANQATSWS